MRKVNLIFIFIIISFFYIISNNKISGTLITSQDYFQSIDESPHSNNWIGQKLDSEYIITRISWKKNAQFSNPNNYLLGVFEASKYSNFSDAVPLHMITEVNGKESNTIEIKVTQSFKYLRYIIPPNKNASIEDFEFEGFKKEENEKEEDIELFYYQPTSLPLVTIHIEDFVQPINKENKIDCIVKIINSNKLETFSLSKIRLRGNASIDFKKKSFHLKLKKNEKLLNMPSRAKKWNLIANHCDKTLLRNTLAFKISSLFKMKYTPACEFVDVMLNGEYLGNYNLFEQIEIGTNRLNIAELDEKCIEEPEVTGGYLIEVDGYAPYMRDVFSKTSKGIYYYFRYPKDEDRLPEQNDYFENFFNKVENEVYSGLNNKIDENEFINYFFIQLISENVDMYWSNYIFKEREINKLFFGPVWDFDIAFGNDFRTYPNVINDNIILQYTDNTGTFNNFVKKILINENLLENMKQKWKEYRKEIITEEKLIAFIEEKAEYIKESRKLNFVKWEEALIMKINTNPIARCTYEAEFNYLKEYIGIRLKQVDDAIEKANEDTIYDEKIHKSWFDNMEETGTGGDYEEVSKIYAGPIGYIDKNCLNQTLE